jgi:hypothetical protein
MNTIKIALLFIAIITIRPAALGEDLTVVGLGACFLCLYLHFIEHSLKRDLKLKREYMPVIVMVFGYWMYIISHSMITDSAAIFDVIKGFATCLFVTATFAIMLSDEEISKKLFRLFIRVMVIMSASYLVTMALAMFMPLDSLLIYQFKINEIPKNVYFPFTPIYGIMTVQDFVFQRFLGIFREAGISQAFMIWAYVSLDRYGLNTKRNKLLLIAGIVGTFSTAGIAIFVATIAIRMLLNGRKVLALIVLPLTYYVVMYAPYIGIASKMVTHSTSITDRTGSMKQSLQLLADHPFGVGIGNSPIAIHSGINLIASLHMIGLIGLILVIGVFLIPLMVTDNRKHYLISIFPLFATALVSQPIIDAPLMYVMILISIYGSREAPFLLGAKHEKVDTVINIAVCGGRQALISR